MNLSLPVLTSTAIKRKKPWPKAAWLGKDQGGLYLLDKARVSQLYLPSGKTRRKIPSVQPFLVDVEALSTSSNGKYLAGALKTGKVFVWERDSDSLHTTPILDKVRNVLGVDNKRVGLFISNCGKKVILLSGFDQIFLWETENNGMNLAPGEPFTGRWVQVQCGDYPLPCDLDKESAVDGIFYQHQVHGSCAVISWVFNKQDKIHITTLRLQWHSVVAAVLNSDYDDNSLPFTVKWSTFVHPLYGLTPAKRVIKSRKAYIGRFSHDGQVLAVAMNQKNATDSRMMFYLTTSSSVAMVTDLKGCGAVTGPNLPASGKLWWISDMAWTTSNLLLIVITRCGSLGVLTKLGEPVVIRTMENSSELGPAFFLSLHPRISFRRPTNGDGDSSMSTHSEADVLRQRFSVAVHPHLPIILSTDGYLVTVLQLPGNASYKGAMATFMTSVSNLIPEVEVAPSMASLITSSTTSKLNLYQSETNLNFIQSTEDLSDNTMSSCSSSLAGYGLASGDQGLVFLPEMSSEPRQPITTQQDRAWDVVEAQANTLKALALGVSTGPYWSKDISSALHFVINGIVKLLSVTLRDPEPLNRSVSSSLTMISKYRKHGKALKPSQLEDCFSYYKMALELFQWDSSYRNAFSLALRMVHGIIKEIISSKQIPEVPQIESSLQFLNFAEELLESVYSWKPSCRLSSNEQVIDRFSPNKSIPKGTQFSFVDPTNEPTKESPQTLNQEEESSTEISEASTLTESAVNPEPSQVAKALSGSWLLLYNHTVQACKHINQQGTVDSNGRSSRLTQLLCDIQKKLQDMGVAIPTDSAAQAEHMSAVASFVDRKFHDNVTVPGTSAVESPGDSLFGRKRAIHVGQEPNQSTPIRHRKTLSLDRLTDVSTIGKSYISNQSLLGKSTETTMETLLSILYLNLQEYNLKSALELVFSLLEPALDHLDTTFSALFTTMDALRVSRGGQDQSTNQLLSVLMQTFPIIRVADKCGVPVVQSLGRFMAAYFSNLPLYVFPAYHPNVLPPFYLGEPTACESTSDESFALSQGIEVVHLDRERVASAVRDQGVADTWCVNNAVELMLLSGLVSEASWISNNLGDWKHALLLSVSHSHALDAAQRKDIPTNLLPSLPSDITPENIILTRLYPVLQPPPSSLSNLPKTMVDVPEDATSTPTRHRLIAEEPNDGKMQLEITEKLVKDVSMILQASVVAGVDVVPGLYWKMLQELLLLVSQVEWIVPEEFYLPAPPLFCPQPPNVETEFLLPRVYRERQLRSDIASSIQRLLTLFHSSNCMTACTQWYVNQLVSANEKWYNLPQDDQEFIVPQSLLAHASIVPSFAAADLSLVRAWKKNPTTNKGNSSPPRPSKTPGFSVSVVLACFRQFCVVTWLLHARDKMSLCARKYRHARNAAPADPEIADQVEGLCWETLRWTLALQPFGSFLGASAQVSDSLLTLLSEMQPSIATAQITAQYFPDPNVIPTTSGRAKFKRLMTQFRAITQRDAGSIEEDNSDEPLSVFYREKCLEYDDELKERERVFGKAQLEVFQRELSDEDLPHGMSKPPVSFTTDKGLPCVGEMVFETSEVFLRFLDTFFMITLTKTAVEMNAQAVTSIPFLLPYEKLFTFSESKTVRELHVKATTDRHKKPPIAGTSLQRSQSYSDVRSSKPNTRQSFSRNVSLHAGQTDIRRSSSMSDVTKAGSNSGFAVLGEDLIELIPRLAWLSRWSSESSYLPTNNMNRATSENHPVMKIDVELPMVVNSLWLLHNVYTPWKLNEDINPEFLKSVPKPITSKPIIEQECLVQHEAIPLEDNLRRASSDSNIPKVTVQSPTTDEESLTRKKQRKELKKKRTKIEEQDERAASRNISDADSGPLPETNKTQASTQPVTKEARRKSRTARRSLVLDTQDGDDQTTSKKDEDIVVKRETPRKKKTSKARPSPSKGTTFDNKDKSASISLQDATHDKTPSVPLVREEVSHVSTTCNMAVPSLGNTEDPTVRSEPGPRSRDRPRRVRNERNLQTNDGMELVLLLRSNPSSLPNGDVTASDVPLLKLSTMANNQGAPEPQTKSKIKESASQTDAFSGANFSGNAGSSQKVVENRNVMSTGIDFGAQYDECRDVSCQTTLSPSAQNNGVPSGTGHPSQSNGVPSSGIGLSDHYNGVSSGTNQATHYSGTPSGSSYPFQNVAILSGTGQHSQSNGIPFSGIGLTHHYNGVPSRVTHTTQYNAVPSGTSHPFQNAGLSSRTSQASQYNGIKYGSSNPSQYNRTPSRDNGPFQMNLSQAQTRIAWPEQNNNPALAPFPLLRFSGKPLSNDTVAKDLVPPYRGLSAQDEKSSDKEESFPLLHVPKQAAQPTKTFRLFEVPPSARDLPLLHIPQASDGMHQRPDLSKIKFADVKTVRDPCPVFTMQSPRHPHLLRVPKNDTKTPAFRSIPIGQKQTPMLLLHMPKEEPKLKLVPAEELEAFEKSKRKHRDLNYLENEKENVKPKKVRPRKRTHKDQKVLPSQSFKDTTSRQRRREKLSKTPQNHRNAESNEPTRVQVKTATQKGKTKAIRPVSQTAKPSVQLERGLSEESELDLSELSDLSDEEQLYFNVQTKPAVTNAQVDEYCRELEEKVKQQFEKELEVLRTKQMEMEVKERVRKEMDKKREQEEVRKRIEEDRVVQERLERERQAREEELQKEEQHHVCPRPAPRKRSVKWENGTFVYQDEKHKIPHPTPRNNAEVQVHTKDFVTSSVDQVTQTTSAGMTDLKPATSSIHESENSSLIPEDKPQAFAPVVPPDVFLGLTFARDGGQDLEDEVHMEHEMETKGNVEGREASSKEKEVTRQFISVADIDNELWEKIRTGSKIVQEESAEQIIEGINEDKDEDVQQDTEQVSIRETSPEPEPEPDEEGDSKTYDSLTVKMMGSIEPPNIQRHLRPSTAFMANNISKQRLSSHLEEMNQRFEAIEKITQNMDREFHSSNVLLNAIDSIGDIMAPPSKPTRIPSKSSVALQRKKPEETSRSKQGIAPWRREPKPRDLETEVSPTEKDMKDETSEQKPFEGRAKEHVHFKDTEVVDDEDHKSIEEEFLFDGDKTIENHTLETRESPDVTPILDEDAGEQPSRDFEESRDIVISHDMAESVVAQAKRNGNLQDDVAFVVSRRSDKEPTPDLPMLSSEKLKEIFSDSIDTPKRASQRSVEKRKKVQDWMAKKRKERHTEWKKQVDDLRSTEFKPFTAASSEGPSSLKKIKLAEKERETKRRAREDTHIDERMKEASNLINEMLSEQVPKANTLQNIRYAPPTPTKKKQSKQNNRYSTKAKHAPPTTKISVENPQPAEDSHRDHNHMLDEAPLTSSPIYSNNTRDFGLHSVADRYNVGARSVTPSGSDFVTTKTYRMHEKEKLRRSQELEKEIQQPQLDSNGIYHVDATSADIDNIMDQIPDGSTLDEEHLIDIDDLLSDDSELKELLTDVLGSKVNISDKYGRGKGANKKGAAPPLLGTVSIAKNSSKPHRPNVRPSSKSNVNAIPGSRPVSTRAPTKSQPSRLTNNKPSLGNSKLAGAGKNQLSSDTMTTTRSRVTNKNNDIFGRGKGKTSKDPETRLDEFDDISPWNTGDSLKMSDDVAQLLAEAKQAIGDDISESSGSIMSNIDWEAVDKIMNDAT